MTLGLKLSLIVAFLIGVWGVHTFDKQQAVSKARTELIAQYDKKLYGAAHASLKKEKALQDDANKLKEDKDAKIKAIDTQLAAAISELRKRPQRPTNITEHPKDNATCTARDLYREDAEFLTREAARADSILLERDYYYDQYESVRRRMGEVAN